MLASSIKLAKRYWKAVDVLIFIVIIFNWLLLRLYLLEYFLFHIAPLKMLNFHTTDIASSIPNTEPNKITLLYVYPFFNSIFDRKE